MNYEKCEYCKGHVKELKVRVDHWWKGTLVVVENVPVGVCSKCGERYYEAKVLKQLDQIAQGKVGSTKKMVVPVADYRKALAA